MGSRLEKNSSEVRKRIAGHSFTGEDGEEYSASTFGGFGDYMRRKKMKLQNLDAELRSQSDKPQIFKNIVAHVNGYTQPSLADLHVLIVSHGGGFQQYLDGKTAVTHIIASQLTPKKKVEFAKYRIVKPAWVVDSVAAARLLPWESYRAVDEGVTQKTLGFDSGRIISQPNVKRQDYREQTETSWYTSQVKNVAAKLNHHHTQDTSSADLDPERSFGGATQLSDRDFLQAEATVESTAAPSPPSGPLPPVPTDTDPLTHEQSPTEAILVDPEEPPVHILHTKWESPVGQEKKQLTAEEHNAILLQNPRLAKSSTANPDFINQYYRESRLHHLSTWKADLKAQLQARAQESSQRQKPKRQPGSRRYVMHVDFDSFFAAVSLRKHPHLKDLPVAIAHGTGPGSEIASCNYPARVYGVKNGMWMKTALELCPAIKTLPYDYTAYEDASKLFYDSILAVDGIVQSISIDEALIDVSDLCIQAGGSDGKAMTEGSVYREQAKANEVALSLRNSVREKTGCDVSIGIGNNILLAKAALRKAKPAGQHLVKPDDVLDFIGELTVTNLPGVAYSIGNKLEEIGVKYVKDIRSLNKEKLINTLGPKTGEKIWDYSRGIDKQEVGEQVIRKSVSAEVNWGIRFINQQQADEFVFSLCEELSKRLLEQLVKGRQMTMKIMRKAADAGMDPPKNLGHGKCDTFNKSIILGVATYEKQVLGKEAVSILRSYNFPPGELRGLGVQMQKLEPIKPSNASEPAVVDTSQRRLQFKKPDASVNTSESRSPRMIPTFAKAAPGNVIDNKPPTFSARSNQTTDPIEETNDSERLSSLAERHELSLLVDNKHTPLNIGGTQFVLPSQIDPSVLEELPEDIRNKLAPNISRLSKDSLRLGSTSHSGTKSRSQSPFVDEPENFLPNESQLDPEALAALPDDVREELLAEYRSASRVTAVRRSQQLLPQSPKKIKPTAAKKLDTTPKKKHKINSVLNRGKVKRDQTSISTLTQSNFLSLKSADTTSAAQSLIDDDNISADFLDELPEDIRTEILAEQKRQRLKSKSGLDLSRRKRAKAKKDEEFKGQQKLILPPQNPRPSFTSRKLSTIPELREAMSSWVQAFSGVDEEGPYQEDTDALAVYLRRVVLDEGDLAKAQAVLEWLLYVIGDWPFESASVQRTWSATVAHLKKEVQRAVGERGLPPLHFSE